MPHLNSRRAQGYRGERLAHYHLVFEEFKRPVLIHVLRTLAGLQVRDTPVLTPGDAAMIANALWPNQRVDASYFNADGCQPLFAPHLSKQQMADESDRLQARYDALCQQHVEQARLNLSAPLAQRKFMPLNAPPAAWGSRAAASLACIEEGHTRDGRLLAQAQDLPQLRKAYEAPPGSAHDAEPQEVSARHETALRAGGRLRNATPTDAASGRAQYRPRARSHRTRVPSEAAL